MKFIFSALLMFLFFISCKKGQLLTRKHDTGIEIILDFNSSRTFEFGVPLEYETDNLYLYLKYGDTIALDISGRLNLWVDKKMSHIHIEYKGEQGYVRGTCLVPPFKEIKYQRVYDLETLMTSSLTPRYAYRPIRQGKWIVIKADREEIWNYNIKINNKYLK